MLVTPIYAALLALGFVILSVLTLRLRRKLKIPIGDGNNSQMLRAIRVHSNFAEYIPFALLLNYMAESQGAPRLLIHLVCLGLLMGRISHAFGVSQTKEDYKFRAFGMAMTFTALVVPSLYLLISYGLH